MIRVRKITKINAAVWASLSSLVLISCSEAPVKPIQIPEPAHLSHYQLPGDTYSGVFFKPGGLSVAVDFWKNTYAVWTKNQVAVHDNRYLDLVYEVISLPADLDPSEQKIMIMQRQDFWRNQLLSLEQKLQDHASLNNDDKRIVGLMERTGRTMAIANGASDRLKTQRGARERFKRGLELSGRYNDQFRQIFRKAGLPEELAFLPHVESSFQASAKSKAGALGMWQFTKSAAKAFMPNGNSIDQRLDPFVSAQGAANYLSYAYKKLGNWPSAITSYNHGIGGMSKAQGAIGTNFVSIVEKYNGAAFGFYSRNYYAQFLAAREIATNPGQFYREGIAYEGAPNNAQYARLERPYRH